MNHYKNKTAFVTGAASGIGFALSKALLDKGANVMMADVDGPGLGEALAKLGGASEHLSSTLCDVRDNDAVQAAAELTQETFGKVHIVINNAGVGLAGRSGEIDLEDWRWIVDINLMGVVHGVEAFTPLIKRHGEGGYILNTASMAGHMTTEYMPPYHATKYAVVGYSESIAPEVAKYNIGVTCLCPTWVKTNIANSGDHKPSTNGIDNDTLSALKQTAQLVNNGMEASRLADLTLAMMSQGRMHVFNDLEARPMIDIRAKALGDDYDAALAWLDEN
ncbi:short-chain type dehydrogenase/reductase [Litorimonas cladophorae]|uniref:Short-chain type dehydrogenase/reductase n=1 Tax=Litorimonas cladophorae TaxID=1220491 RepID=A0A918NHN1_9PROT|nr:SDR family NAD(P)-dependent oxidoreductase [Litorimonas cladophorae]GGX73817.1 short-chain type dehydrogenase/reductase [Litorimonas cladophorae]